MKSPLFELQKAIFGRLAVLSCPIYDAVPQGASFPYVTIGEDTAIDWGSKTTDGQEVTVTLHQWSRYNGMAEVKQIGGEVIELMTVTPLIMTGFKADTARLDMSEVIMDADGITRHGITRFRLFISEVVLAATENFESGSKGSYALGDVTLDSGSWKFDNALLGTTASDKKNGSKSARISSVGSISMNFDVNGAQSVTLQHANFGDDSGASWTLQKSTNGGSSWTDIGGPYSSGSALEEQTITVNESGTVRFKIMVSGTTGYRINIDDFYTLK